MELRIDDSRFMKQHKDVAEINGRLAAVIKMVAASILVKTLASCFVFFLLFEATTTLCEGIRLSCSTLSILLCNLFILKGVTWKKPHIVKSFV